MGFVLLILIYGTQAVFIVIGIAFLIRHTINSKQGSDIVVRKAKRQYSYAKVVDKIHYYCTMLSNGFLDQYYITFLLDNNDEISLRVPKKLIKKVQINDKVKLFYEGTKFISLEFVEKSGIKSNPRDVVVSNWRQFP